MLLLFLHLPQNGVLLDLDQISPLVLSKAKPELFDPFALLRRVRTPDLAVVLRTLGEARTGRWTGFMGGRCIGRWWRWMVVRMIMWIRMGGYRCL